ncbi:MAG: hypothetical protein H0W72_10950 [Planctomycetes bacterium]|nr:hypothetical protein [Planctomycetota bacterium]
MGIAHPADMPAPDGAPDLSLFHPIQAVQAPGGRVAWNPLPVARRGLVAFVWPSGAPQAVIDQHGRRHPAQSVPDGFIVEFPFLACEALSLSPIDDQAAGALWETSPSVLDNGLVRAEFDADGSVTRLCLAGRYVTIVEPLVRGLGAPISVTVIERGPVRARLEVRRMQGVIRYSLHAHEPLLRVELDAAAGAVTHVVAYIGAPVAGTLASWTAIGEPEGAGLAVLGALTTGTEHAVAAPAMYALSETQAIAWSCGRRALELAHPPLAVAAAPVVAAMRLAGLERAITLARQPPAGWDGDLVLVDESGRSARGWLFVTGTSEAWIGDARGWRALSRTVEGDGWQIDLPPHARVAVRWRTSPP